MDRAAWLRERREAVRARYDAEAATYDDQPYPTTSHTAFIDRLVATCPDDGLVLDAPCGTGPYFARIRDAGRRVVAIDQSAGMLVQATGRGLAERVERIGLQEMTFEAEFDGAMTVDAVENVSPEDWPVVLRNLRRAVRPGGYLYLTVEEVEGTRSRRPGRRTGNRDYRRSTVRSSRATSPATTTTRADRGCAPG
jgi:SAM-dependent methyltransferase